MVKQSLSTVSSISGLSPRDQPDPKPSEFYECDYERNCSPLYKAIETAVIQEDEDFDNVAVFCETGRWKNRDTPSGPSANIQAKTWVTRFQTKKGKKTVEWSQLPLHLAIVGGAPSNVIGGLVKLYPQALRCTDDQQMLPLHLALRHGADDEIVAYLLMQFPEAVNAQGKNGRSAVDCALRARDKLRGIVLETFVEKTKAKLMATHSKELDKLAAKMHSLQKTLDASNFQLDAALMEVDSLKEVRKEFQNVQTDYESLKTMKASMEESLMAKLNDLSMEKSLMETNMTQRVQKLESEKLTESIEFQKKIDILTAEKNSAANAEQRAMAESETLRKELGDVHKNVAKANDWDKLKSDLSLMHGEQLARNRSKTLENIDDLKSELHGNLEKSVEDKIKSELKGILKTVKKLERTGSKVKNTDDMNVLRSEVDTLRAELRETAAASSLKVELTSIRKSLEDEAKLADDKTAQQMKHLAMAMAETKPAALETKSVAELTGLKSQLESLQLELKEQKLLHKTTNDIHELELSLQTILEKDDNASNKELASMTKAIGSLKSYLSTPKSKEDLVSVSKDVKTMKELLHAKDLTMKIHAGLFAIQELIAKEAKSASGKTRSELLAIQNKAQNLMEKATSTNVIDELEAIQVEMLDMKKDMHHVQEAIQTQREIGSLKKTLENEISQATKQSKKELSEMKKAVDAINLEHKESKNVKSTLGKEIKKATSKTEKDLLNLKKNIEKMDITSVESKNKHEWEAIRTELDALKSNLKQVKQDDGQISDIKTAIAELSMEQESKTDAKLEQLRKEMMVMRANLSTSPSPALQTTRSSSPNFPAKPKKKNMLKKFFGIKKKPVIEPASAETADQNDKASEVPTFLPPSMSKDEVDLQADDNSDSGLPPAVQMVNSMKEKKSEEKKASTETNDELEETLELHRSMSQVDADAVRALPTFDSVTDSQQDDGFLPSAMRKVRSMDPRMKNVTIDPAEVVRSWSKNIMSTLDGGTGTTLESVEESRTETSPGRE